MEILRWAPESRPAVVSRGQVWLWEPPSELAGLLPSPVVPLLWDWDAMLAAAEREQSAAVYCLAVASLWGRTASQTHG